MPNLSTPTTKTNTAVSGEAANYGAAVGQQIAGDLYRGSGGKFTSGPTDAQLKDLGMERETSDALLALMGKKEISPEHMTSLIQSGWATDAGNLTTRGRALAMALKNKNLPEIKRLLALAPKGKGGAKKSGSGKGKAEKLPKKSKDEITAENREKVKPDLETAGLSSALQSALFKYRSGKNVTEAQLKKLASLGLVIFGVSGYRMSPDGNKLVRAADKGDSRAALDALASGKDRAKKAQDKTKPITPTKPKTTRENMSQLNEATKTVNGRVHDTGDFLVTVDKEKPTTWHLPVMVKGKPDHRLMGAAWAALHGGYRGQKYAGPEKTQAISKLKSLYKKEGMEVPMGELQTVGLSISSGTSGVNGHQNGRVEATNQPVAEMFMSLSDFINHVIKAFNGRFRTETDGIYDRELGHMWVKDVFFDHPVLGNSLVTMHKGECWAVEWAEGERGEIVFADMEEWAKVIPTYVYADGLTAGDETADMPETTQETAQPTADQNLSESETGSVISLTESDDPNGPLVLEVAVIKPGWGNERDNNYYPAEMLKQNAAVFEGAKMYATDHRVSETSVLTEVSAVLKCPVGFTEEGAPIAKVGIFDPQFAQSVRNRQKLGLLNSLHCSILAQGKVSEKQFEENGRKGRRVESISSKPQPRIDWVTNAGAGGHALRLSESEPQPKPMTETANTETGLIEATLQEQQPPVVYLTEKQVTDHLATTRLPTETKTRIAKMQFISEQALQGAVTAEIAYIKAVTGSGQPPQQGNPPAAAKPVSLNEALDRANQKFLGNGPRK